jgi:EpsI family protein
MPDLHGIIAGGFLAALAAMSPLLEPHRILARELPPLHLESDVPTRMGDWRQDDSIHAILPSPDVQEQLDKIYSQQLSRTYVNSVGNRIMLVIAYGEDQTGKESVAHLPEGCYPAQGFVISPRPARPVPLEGRELGVTRLVASHGARVEPITYWTTVGGKTFHSDLQRRYSRIRTALDGVIPDGMLVRVSSIDRDEQRAFLLHDDFVMALRANLAPKVLPRVLGDALAGT